MPGWTVAFALAIAIAVTLLVAVLILSRLQVQRKTEQLRKSRERLEMALAGADLGLWDRDVKTGNVVVNRRWAEMLGYELSDIRPGFDTWQSMVHPDDLPSALVALESHFEGKTAFYECEYRMRSKAGDWKWVLSRGQAVERDRNGTPLRVSGTHSDIDQRKRAVERLSESEERYRLLFDSMLSAFALHEIICDDDGKPVDYRFLEVNPAFTKLTGLKAEDVVGRTAREVIPGLEQSWVDIYGEVALTGKPTHFDRRSAELNRCYAGVAFCPRKGQFAVIFQDVTLRRQEEEKQRTVETELQHSQKLESLGVLAGGVAHDFNNLLMGVLGNAGLALDEIPESWPAHGSVKEIELAAKRAADLCRQMLAYSGRGRHAVEPLHLNDVLRDMRHLLAISVSKTVVLRLEPGDNLPVIHADLSQLRQVIMNLVTNASEAVDERSGVVRVATGACSRTVDQLDMAVLAEGAMPGNFVFVEVSDTGLGMDAGTLSKIFDPFFTTKFMGRGLGLAAVLGIMRRHAGVIEVESRPGKGSVFRVCFPAHENGAASAEPGHEERETEKALILLVDDDETVRTVGRRMLERAGYAVLLAVDGREAVSCFEKDSDRIKCVLLDLTMPRMGGAEAFKELRKIRDDVLVIASSGYDEEALRTRFEGLEVAGYLQKPYTAESLCEMLAKLIAKDAPPEDQKAPL